jgi:hypothetical protein
MAKYLGNIVEDATINFKFHTTSTAAVPTTLAGTPAVKVYKDNATGTETATGVTLSVDFDSVTGLNNVAIDTSADAFYATGSDYQAVITTGTVDSVSVVGAVVAEFSIENRFDEVDMTKVHGSALTETSAGYLAAGFVKQYDVAFPVFTAASVDQTGDTFAVVPTNFEDMAITNTTGLVSVGTNNDKTGYTASTVSDKTGYSISGAITTLDGLNNFDPAADTVADVTLVATTTDVTNGVTASTVSDKTGYALSDAGVDAIWEEPIAGHTTADTYGTKNKVAVPSETLADYKATGYSTPTNVSDSTTAVNAHTDTRTLASAAYFDPAADTVANVTTVATTTDVTNGVTASTVSDKTGYSISGVITTLDGLNNFDPAADTVADVTLVATTTDVTNGVTASTVSDKTGYSISGTKTTLDALNDITTTQVNTEADTALSDIHLDHLLAVAYDPASKPGAADALWNEMVENDGGVARYTANALEQAPSGTGGDATEAKQDTMIASLAAAKGSGFVEATDSQEAIRNRGDAAWTGTATDGAVPVNHDTGGTDTLLVTDENDVPLGGAVQRAYRKVDYDASSFVVRASATTDDNGEWGPIYLSDGVTYTLVANYQGRIATAEVTPAA